MAQDFERAVAKDSNTDIDIGTTARAVYDCNSDDAIVGIRMANVITSQITVSCFVRTDAANPGSGNDLDVYLIKNAPIPAGSSLELIDGGSKMVLQNGDILKVKSNTADSLNCWVSFVDSIST